VSAAARHRRDTQRARRLARRARSLPADLEVPERRGIEPSYEQKAFAEAERQGYLRLVASRDGRGGSVLVHQDVNLYAILPGADERIRYEVPATRRAWIHVARGSVEIDGTRLDAGDAAAVGDAGTLDIVGRDPAEVLVFDLA
jgi:redox-sensitive bicupin YhaK (pirin superfamily)